MQCNYLIIVLKDNFTYIENLTIFDWFTNTL